MQFTRPVPVLLKVIICILFVFLNRAQRILRSNSMIVTIFDLTSCALLPLFVSALLHVAVLCPAFASPTRAGRVAVLYALLHTMCIHGVSVMIVITTLRNYPTSAGFLSVLLGSHLCLSVYPTSADLLPGQAIWYGRFMPALAFVIPIISWLLLPILRVHELEAIALLYVPEVICFTFAHVLQFFTIFLDLSVATVCSLMR